MLLKRLLVAALVCFGLWSWAAPHLSAASVLDWTDKNQDKPGAAAIFYVIGWRYYERSDYLRAQETLGRFVADFPAGPHTERALLRLADAAEQNRDYPAARDALDRFLKDYPDSGEAGLARHRRDLLNSR